MQHKIIARISDNLKQDLPGWEAQKTMSPVSSDRYMKPPDDAKQSAVLTLISHNKDNQLQITFIKRASHPQDPHGGQIGFPGGSMENSDRDLLETAIRECYEELGIKQSNYKILGPLSPIYVFVSNFYLQPYVAYSNLQLNYNLQESEVAHVIEVPFDNFYNGDILKRKDYKTKSTIIKNMPYYDLNQHVLWGATAMITAELLSLAKDI